MGNIVVFDPANLTAASIETQRADEVLITNLSMPTANTEYSLGLQTTLRKIIIQSRNKAIILVAFVAGETATNYITIPYGCSLELDDLSFTSKTLYVKSNQASTILEVVETYKS